MNTRVHQQPGDYLMSNNSGMAVRRIRSPNQHDVLCGRGGGINSHAGNRVFREYVAERRLDYNLAGSKADKALVAKLVMELVTSKGGRFLQRDSTGGIGSWWVEIDEIKAMAKTSQALREGAPTIRAQHKEEIQANRRTKRSRTTPSTEAVTSSPGYTPLISNATFEQQYRPTKVAKIADDDTPTLVPTYGSDPPTLYLTPTSAPVITNTVPMVDNSKEWKITGHLEGEFVNPFENEEERLKPFFADSYPVVVSPQHDAFTSCVHCCAPVQHGKSCNCMSAYDPLNTITEIATV